MHFSKVRSLTLDTWEPELLKVSVETPMSLFTFAFSASSQRPLIY